MIDPRGVRHEFTYNEVDWLVEQRFAVSHSSDGAQPLSYRTQVLHDANGNVVELRKPFGVLGDTVTREWFTYGPLDEPIRIEREISLGETAVGIFAYDPNRNLIGVTNPEGELTEIDYDERDLAIQIERGRPGLDPPIAETFAYDEEGRLRATTDAEGGTWELTYDGYQRPMAWLDPLDRQVRRSYDDAGNPLSEARFDASGCLVALSTATYDLQGRRTAATDHLWSYDPPPVPCEELPPTARALTTRFTYNTAGEVVQVTDPLDRATELAYDGARRLRSVLDPEGNETVYELDAAGNPVREEVIEALPGGGTSSVETFHDYDALNRRIATRDALANEWRQIVDARGLVRVAVDPEGFVTEVAYDGLDRATSLTLPGDVRVEVEYDRASRPVVYRDALGNETTSAYDDLGRVTAVTYADGTSESWQYDGADNPVGHTDALGTVVAQSFDLARRLTGRQVTPAAGVEGPTAESFGYDALDRMIAATSGGVAAGWQYDSVGRLLAETRADRTVAYAHDDAGAETGLGYPSGRVLGRLLDG
ncbi:MAG: hypothetical protein ACREF4_18950, partial [Gammaproteobacteria bacterium]